MRLLADRVSPDQVLMHPEASGCQEILSQLIDQLRRCGSLQECYEFQDALLTRVLAVETDRNGFSQAVKRMKAGDLPQAGAPEPQSGLDTTRLETWQLEHDVCERVARQLRCLGDALAWRVFGFQREHIIALCLNASSGVMAGKKGLPAEIAEVEKARADRKFAIMHDLTNCLRIGDVTIFGNDRTATTIEVKTNPLRSRTVQNKRIATAASAVLRGSPLPGQDPKTLLYDLDVPFLPQGSDNSAMENSKVGNRLAVRRAWLSARHHYGLR